MAEAAWFLWHKALHTILGSAMSDSSISLLILLATLMKSSAWSSAAFSIAPESILVTSVPTNRSRLDDQSHSLLMLWERVVFIAEEDNCRELTWKVSMYMCGIRREEYVVHHAYKCRGSFSCLQQAISHGIDAQHTEWSKMAETRGSAPAQERKQVISESVGKHLLYGNTAGEWYGQVAEGLFLQFFPICTGNEWRFSKLNVPQFSELIIFRFK